MHGMEGKHSMLCSVNEMMGMAQQKNIHGNLYQVDILGTLSSVCLIRGVYIQVLLEV